MCSAWKRPCSSASASGVALAVADVHDARARAGMQLPDDEAALGLVDDLELDREGLALEADETRQGGTGANAVRREEYGVEALERRHRPSRTTSESGSSTRQHLRGNGVGGEECGNAVGVDHVKMSSARRR